MKTTLLLFLILIFPLDFLTIDTIFRHKLPQQQPQSPGNVKGFTYNGNLYKVTKGKYLCTDNLEIKIINELGDGWNIAEWEKIKSMNTDECKTFISTLRLKTNEGFLILRHGSKYWSNTNRHYFFERHNHNKPPSFAAYDNIDNYNISLGSWNNITMRILAAKPVN